MYATFMTHIYDITGEAAQAELLQIQATTEEFNRKLSKRKARFKVMQRLISTLEKSVEA